MAKKISRGGKRFIVALVAILTLAGAGLAIAYWTSGGFGAGRAQTGSTGEFTITTSEAVGLIAPGNAGATVDFTVDNSGENSQYLTNVTVAVGEADGGPWVPATGCLAEDYTATMTTAPPAGDIAAGDSVAGMVTVTMANTAENQDACQGQEVPLYFVAT